MMYQSDDLGLCLTMVTMPFHGYDEFVKNEFTSGLYKNYKEALVKHFSDGSQDSKDAEGKEFEDFYAPPTMFYVEDTTY